MADIANLKIGTSTYGIKDGTARTQANDAETKADQAIADSASAQADATLAQNTATAAQTSATQANNKIDNTKIVGNYTQATQTLEIALQIGSASATSEE